MSHTFIYSENNVRFWGMCKAGVLLDSHKSRINLLPCHNFYCTFQKQRILKSIMQCPQMYELSLLYLNPITAAHSQTQAIYQHTGHNKRMGQCVVTHTVLRIPVFWNVTFCWCACCYSQHFKWLRCLHHQRSFLWPLTQVHTITSQGTSSIPNYTAELAHTFFLKMSDGIHSTGVAMHSLFLAAIHSVTDTGLLLKVTGCDAVDRNMMVRLYGSNIAAWQRSH